MVGSKLYQGTHIATIIVLQTYHDKLAVTVMSGPHDPSDCLSWGLHGYGSR